MPDQLQRPETHDKRPGMGTPQEMWRYRLAQRVRGLRLLGGGLDGEGWSIRQVAKWAKMAPSTLLRIESGEGCKVEHVIALANLFGVSPDFLLGYAKVPPSAHELVDRAYESMMSLASSMEYAIERPNETTINDMRNTVDMIARSLRNLVDLTHRLRYPDPDNLNVRVPYGYEFVQQIEGALGHDIDQ